MYTYAVWLVLMMMLLKWNVCLYRVRLSQWDVRASKREIETKRERRKPTTKKYKYARMTLAPIIERFHSVLLTSHRCARHCTERKRKKTETKKSSYFITIFLFSLSPSLFLFIVQRITCTPLLSLEVCLALSLSRSVRAHVPDYRHLF